MVRDVCVVSDVEQRGRGWATAKYSGGPNLRAELTECSTLDFAVYFER